MCCHQAQGPRLHRGALISPTALHEGSDQLSPRRQPDVSQSLRNRLLARGVAAGRPPIGRCEDDGCFSTRRRKAIAPLTMQKSFDCRVPAAGRDLNGFGFTRSHANCQAVTSCLIIFKTSCSALAKANDGLPLNVPAACVETPVAVAGGITRSRLSGSCRSSSPRQSGDMTALAEHASQKCWTARTDWWPNRGLPFNSRSECR